MPGHRARRLQGQLSLLTAKSVRINGVRVQRAAGLQELTLNTGQRKTVAMKLPRGVGRIASRSRTL